MLTFWLEDSMTKKDQICKLVVEGKTNNEIAQIVSMNRHDLCKIIRKFKQSNETYIPKEDIDIHELESLIADGYTQTETAKLLGWSISKVNYYVKKYKIQKPQHSKRQKDLLYEILPLFNSGMSRAEISDNCGLTPDAISDILSSFGYSFRERNDTRQNEIRAEVEKLAHDGLTAREIAQVLNITAHSVYYHLPGFKFTDHECHDDIAELRRSGCSIHEICLITGKNRKLVSEKCRDIGLRATKEELEESKEIVRSKNAHTEDWAKNYIHERSDGRVEYVSGYTNMDSRVIVRCTQCNSEWSMGFCSFRTGKNPGICKVCNQPKKKKVEHSQEYYELQKQIKEERKIKRIQYQQAQIMKREQREIKACSGAQRFFNFCSSCGELILDRANGLCKECTHKAKEARHDAKRRARIDSQIIDVDITNKKLYERDNGICYLCGGKCDWNDFEIRNGYFITGHMYPSIDHVIPLSKGGLHSWDNVKLSHKICNSIKRDVKYDKTIMDKTNSEGNDGCGDLSAVI